MRTILSFMLLVVCCAGCMGESAIPSPGRKASIYTGFGMPRGDVLCFKSHADAKGTMQISMRLNGASTEEWYMKLPPEDRAKLEDSYRSKRVQDEMFSEGHWVLIPYGTQCVVLEDENNGRGDGSPYKVKILNGQRSGEEWWVYRFQLDLEQRTMTPAEIADARPSDDAR